MSFLFVSFLIQVFSKNIFSSLYCHQLVRYTKYTVFIKFSVLVNVSENPIANFDELEFVTTLSKNFSDKFKLFKL